MSETGKVIDARGSVGFSGALIPYLDATGNTRALEAHRARLAVERAGETGLYGQSMRYYDQNLILFSTGWSERRFRFDASGRLELTWRNL